MLIASSTHQTKRDPATHLPLAACRRLRHTEGLWVVVFLLLTPTAGVSRWHGGR